MQRIHASGGAAVWRWVVLGLAIVVLAVVVLLLTSDTAARSGGVSTAEVVDVPKGFDLFETDPEQTVFRFEGQAQIPANFFGPGSKPFSGTVEFGGVPIGQFNGKSAGGADTVVQRKENASLPVNGSTSGQIPIELVRLSLVGLGPIAVQVNNGFQLWDVRARLSRSRPSTGTMVITRASGQGGTFDSQLKVYPSFTFTRLSDGATKLLDVGALPDGQRPDDPITAQKTPWRAGCTPPALDTGLGANFCPGQRPNGRIVRTLEQSPLINHAVWPVQPAVEHFECYSVPKSNLKTVTATLKDQFGKRAATVDRGGGGRLCNPARKQNERKVENRHDHLRCFPTDTGTSANVNVQLRNQFGSFGATVLEPVDLCLPSTKQVFQGNTPPKPAKQKFLLDHYQCYKIKAGTFASRIVHARDQFGERTLDVIKPIRLCAPVAKNGARIKNSVQHLVCYRAKPGLAVPTRQVSVHNQFGGEVFDTGALNALCVPTRKVVIPTG